MRPKQKPITPPPHPSPPALVGSPDDNYRTWYEIFVYSFCDSNGDGLGDLQGVTDQLDYLQNLGITGIWLMPIHPSSSYHKYNVSDYYAIDPDYGTMEDFETLMAECEKRGIHVILDLVVNHTGSDHPWFQEAAAYLQSLGDAEPDVQACPYVDYYNFTKEPKTAHTQVPGTDWYYESQFSSAMPDLNLDSELVRQEIGDIMRFWLDKGVAGFRLDAAKEFNTGSNDKNLGALIPSRPLPRCTKAASPVFLTIPSAIPAERLSQCCETPESLKRCPPMPQRWKKQIRPIGHPIRTISTRRSCQITMWAALRASAAMTL